MKLLVLGGTAWLGRELARTALEHGDDVTCLARGDSGDMPSGVTAVHADRTAPDGLDVVAGQEWDAVVDVTRQPGQARAAAHALAGGGAHLVFVSTVSVYADNARRGADESSPLLDALDGDVLTEPADYGRAKVACERAVLDAVGPDRCLIARPGLLAGPGDPTGRAGYWAARFADPAGPGRTVLVPDAPGQPCQVLDVRDLARWLHASARDRVAGTMDAVGEGVTLGEFLDVAHTVAGGVGRAVPAAPEWLRRNGVAQFSGPRSLPLWIDDPAMAGFGDRPGAAARAAGLMTRPLVEILADGLRWEQEQSALPPRAAGLTAEDEHALLAALVAVD
ncbi:MAG: NAD-dependent epimerase/dehydratase family protein [Geodermatophilaceae bacterium]|nr:NAD-dependent epimerase/dehydratase family protein [Geodermatophilaceae bacterium]